MNEHDKGQLIPRVRIYWDAFERNQLEGAGLPTKVIMLIKLAFFSGAFATITFRRLVSSEVPENARNPVLQGFCDDIEREIRHAESFLRSGLPFKWKEKTGRRKSTFNLSPGTVEPVKKAVFRVTKTGSVQDVDF